MSFKKTPMLTIPQLKELIKDDIRYKDFTIFDKTMKFNEFMANKNVSVVETHLTTIAEYDEGKELFGFCGTFEWKDNKIISLDGDSYNKEMTIYGYKWFVENEILFILVGNDW